MWLDDRLDRHGGLAPLPIRLFLGVFLIYMSQDNVFSAARMDEFEGFLKLEDFPLPAVSARISVYAQFLCGMLIIAGAFTRLAALVMAVNFTVAIAVVHWNLPFRSWLEPCAMLGCALALLIGGAGRISIDTWRRRR